MDVKGEFAALELLHPGKSIAAYLEPAGNGITPAVKPTLHFHVSNHVAIPAAAAMLDALEDGRVVYTNLAPDHWLTTYMSGQLVHMGNVAGCAKLKKWQRDSVDWVVSKVAPAQGMALRIGGRFLGDGPGPIGGGGLGAAAKTVAARPAMADPGKGRDKAIERALRYYALASYAVISRARHHSMMLGNYVGAILVSDSGRIMGWGFNSTSYHHAEVNLTLAYLMANPGATALPANSVVFSSLTPCKQCATLLQTVRKDTNTIFYGQYDSGEFGKVGADTSAKIDTVTKPVVVGAKPARTEVAKTLTSEVAKSNIAKNIGESAQAKDLIDKTLDEIGRRALKERKAEDPEQAVKAAVLQHIKEVLDSISI